MSPTKSGAKSRKRSFPIAHRLAPFMQNFSKSTFFRLNSFTVHVSHSATWLSVHCLGSEEDQKRRLSYALFPRSVCFVFIELTYDGFILCWSVICHDYDSADQMLPNVMHYALPSL